MKTVVITGSSKGIGLGLAHEFLNKGCNVVFSSFAKAEMEEACSRAAEQFGQEKVFAQECDVTDVPQLQKLWDVSKERFGKVDIWMNNAGIANKTAPLCELEPRQISAVVDTNLKGVILATQVALRGMLAQGGGQIYNSEGFGSDDKIIAGLSVYGSTKRGVRYFSEAMAEEVSDLPVQIGTISPGIVITDFLIDDMRKMDPDKLEMVKAVYNTVGDTVETVTPYLAEEVLNNQENGRRIIWLTDEEANRRFQDEKYYSRDFFTEKGL